MRCPECNGIGETNYYVEVDRDENSVTVARRKDICRTCNGSGEKPMTNADRIRAMSDEELAEWIASGVSADPCDYCEANIDYCNGSLCRGKADAETIIEWLRQPAE